MTEPVALITGGARGVGAEVARRLAARGYRLILTDLDAEPLYALAAELGADRVHAVIADVCDLDAMQAAVDDGVERFGGIDVVMANAGIASYGSVMNVDPAAFKRVIDVNVMGVFNTVRAAGPSVIERKGYILVVSSLAAFAAAPGLAAYNASKAGVELFTDALRAELAHEGVAVGSAHMSWIDTPLVQDAKKDLSAFRKMLDALPGPLGKTTSVEACGKAFVAGIEKRKRHVYVPGWVGALRWAKPLVNGKAGQRETLKQTPEILPLMDAEVAAMGRSMSARTQALEAREEAAVE